MLSSLSIAGSALTAERYRMNVALQNLANISTTRTAEGEPYRRKQVVFEERAVDFKRILETEQGKVNGGVRVAEVVSSQRDFNPVYDPTHPDANEEGYVMYPNVNRAEEQVDLMAASRAYEANLTALNVIKSTALKALEIGK
ncbi:MAG: flagellar basal body rod protein FlgC [Provencibacterium sp.]|jgi:flagellar basal-body rod protein FlgC|nr:flagellar basal body rod protein FlgC [Provencibacterium sp.]